MTGGFLPMINFAAIGFGAARYVSSDARLDGTPAERQRNTSLAVRVDVGLSVSAGQRLGFRFGGFAATGAEAGWLQRLNVVPAGERLSSVRVGGYGVVYVRR